MRGAGHCSCPTRSSRGLAALPNPSGASHCGKKPLAFLRAGAEPAGSKVGGGRGKLQPPPKLGILQVVVLGKENWKTKVPNLQLVPGVSEGGWCLGLEAPRRLEHQAWLGWELSQRLFHPPGLPEESSAPRWDLIWGPAPLCLFPALLLVQEHSLSCLLLGVPSPGSPALALPISHPKLEGVEPVWWDHSQLPLPGRSRQHRG